MSKKSKQEYKTVELKGTCPVAAYFAEMDGDMTKAKNNLMKKFADQDLKLSDFNKDGSTMKYLGENDDGTFSYEVSLKAEKAAQLAASGNQYYVGDAAEKAVKVAAEAEERKNYKELKVTNDDDYAAMFAQFGDIAGVGGALLDTFASTGLSQFDFDLKKDPIRFVGQTDTGLNEYVIRVKKDVAEKIVNSGNPAFVADVTACPEKFPATQAKNSPFQIIRI